MKLKISWEDFSKQIDDFVTEGKAFNDGNEIKSYKEDYSYINSDKEEVSKKIDEIINQLTKLGYGQEIIFGELEECTLL